MAKIKVSYGLAMAAGQDAGNKNMRKAGRKSWSQADYNVAAKEAGRLLKIMYKDLRRSKNDTPN